MGDQMATKVFQTAIILTLLFMAAIKFHGDNDPRHRVKCAEVIGLFVSSSTAIVFALIVIWME